ncbi:MAG TPA: adenosylmethionine decarboxylase [Ktedonobacterales bacterium]
MFGPHLILDGSQCDTQKLGDRILIEQMLNDYPAAIGMTKIGGPYMFEYQAPDPAYSGVSGIVVIAESHIAIHTFPALDYFSMDIFSCKNFDHEKAIRYIQDALDVKQMDRMLVQRGLSFRGPHHGANGANDELIAAAQHRLDAGIISNETVTEAETAAARAGLLAQRAGHADPQAEPAQARDEAAPPTSAGRMIWPEYGVTPDVGSFGPGAPLPGASLPAGEALGARGGARVVPLHAVGSAASAADGMGAAVLPIEPVQVNPTASISGLLDKLGGVGLGGRALSQALGEWERLARDPRAALALALDMPVVAAGLREVLVYLLDHRYVDVVIASGADVFADVYEALGYAHVLEGGAPVATTADRARTAAFVAEFASALAAARGGAPLGGRDFLRALGEALPTRAPRKGLLQAAAAAGVPVFCPDLVAGPLGAALLAARAGGAPLHLDPLDDLAGLAAELGRLPHLGVIRVGRGPAAALALEAHAIHGTATLLGVISLGAPADDLAAGQALAAVASDATLALPLVVSGLAQRIPGTRGLRARKTGTERGKSVPHAEQALA